jgi:chromate transporter
MQAGIAAVIIDVVLGLAGNIIKKKQVVSIFIMIGAFIATYYFKVNVAYIILICGFIGAAMVIYREKNKKERI